MSEKHPAMVTFRLIEMMRELDPSPALLSAIEACEAEMHAKAVLWDEGFQACAEEHMRQQREPTYPICRPNPYLPSGQGFPQ